MFLTDEEYNWGTWRRDLLNFNTLTEEGRELAVKMASSFQSFFGDKVIKDPSYIFWNVSVAGLSPVNQAPQIFKRLLNVYAHIELLKYHSKPRGLHDLISKLAYSSTHESWRHLTMQMELAGFAARNALECQLEASTRTGKTSDVTIWLNDGGTIDFEATALGETTENIKLGEFYNSFQNDLAKIQFEYNVAIQGKVYDCPSELERGTYLDRVHYIARKISRYGGRKTIKNNCFRISVISGAETGVPNLTCIYHPVDTWHRIQRKIDKLARKLEDKVWIRIDDVSGLFNLTHWAQMSLFKRLVSLYTMAAPLLKLHPNVDGFVLTNHTSSLLDKDETSRFGRHVAMRRDLGFMWGRETFILSRPQVEEKATHIENWFSNEPSWYDWAANELKIPPLNRLIKLE